MNKVSLGERLRRERKAKGYTQEKLSEMVDVSQVYFGQIERGVKMPSLKTFIKIIEALNISADSILCDELSSGKDYVYDELTKKLEALTPKQRKTAADILDAYIRNL